MIDNHGANLNPTEPLDLERVPAIDPRVVNPIGYRWSTAKKLAAICSVDPARPGWDAAMRTLEAVRGWGEVQLDVFTTDGTLGDELAASIGVRDVKRKRIDSLTTLERMRRYRGVVDHAALHPSVQRQAALIVRWSAAGVPVIVDAFPAALRELLGEPLAAALEHVSLDALADPGERERASVAIRREALRHHSAGTGRGAKHVPGPPGKSISVVLATKRPGSIEHAIAQVNQQGYQPRELVVVLHGELFPSGAERSIRRLAEGPVTLVRVGSEASLGKALNAGIEAASGEVITKMDDDDWYGREHLWDLMLALAYSGAELVGKGAEFVYLQEPDLTIRRFVGKAESSNRTLGGGSITMLRSAFDAVDGFRDLAHGEDQAIIDDLLEAGVRRWRTHGYGFLTHRHQGNTWQAPPGYFLSRARAQRPGLALDWAMGDLPAGSGESRNRGLSEATR